MSGATSSPDMIGVDSGRPLPEPVTDASSRRVVHGISWFMACLLAVFVIKQVVFVLAFQPFSGHDEVAHYSYLELLATEGRVPVLPDLDTWRREAQGRGGATFDQIPTKLYPYCRYAIDWHCEPFDWQWSQNPPRMVTYLGQLFPTGFQYTANHPPLYYALMVPVYWAVQGLSLDAQQYLLRLAAIPFGLAIVYLAYRMTRDLFPNDSFLLVTVPTVVAFQPQISYEAAMINNDIVAIAMFSLLLFLVVRGIVKRFPMTLCLILGVALGLAVLTKSTSLTIAPVIALAVILTVGWRNVSTWLARGICIVLPALLIAFPWYLFMYRTYGNLDALEQIRDLQFWNQPAGTFLELLTDREFVIMRFRETWGEFGWRLIPLDLNLLWAIAIPALVAVAGLVWYAVRVTRQQDQAIADPVFNPGPPQKVALAMLVLTCLIAYLAVVQFGTQFALTQARYFFPVINAAALLTMLGMRTIIPAGARRYAQGLVFGAMLMVNILIFVQYVFPQFVSV